MDKVIVTIPDWAVYVVALWILLAAVKTGLDIYFSHLKRKFEQMERTTTTTISVYPFSNIINIMKAISEQADDTIWFNDGTTVFEELWGLYLDLGGDESVLAKEFPENA